MGDIQYSQVKNTAGFRQITNPGYLRFSGETKLDFLQRQSTNNLNKLRDNEAITTILTSPTARILDVLTVFKEDSAQGNTLGVLSLPTRGEQTTAFLKSRIFFMDKVTIDNVSDQYSQFDIEGPLAFDILKSAGIHLESNLSNFTIDGNPICVVQQKGFTGKSFRLIGPVSAANKISKFLEKIGISGVDDEVFEIIRIESGLPAPDHEIADKYTPLEVNLDEFISSNKGCYTGQEILARQITYDKITRKLVGLQLSSQASAGNIVLAESKQVGEVTSFTHSPTLGFIALCILKRPFFSAHTQVEVSHKGELLPAIVVELPF